MNVFYPKTTRGLKSALIGEETATLYFTSPTVYSICSEGALYSSPRYIDGSYDSDEWVEVDFDEVEACDGIVYRTMLQAIQDCLVCEATHNPSSGYYQSAAA